MGKDDRLALISRIIDESGSMSYQKLAKALNVSRMTVRRDIALLSSKGKLIKTLGGAHRSNAQSNLYESPLMSRLYVNSREKRAIAAIALDYIKPNETIYLDGSTTCLELAKSLSRFPGSITVVTNSSMIFLELTKTNSHTIFCIGGQHDPESFCLTGLRAEEEAHKYFVDKAFFSTKGFISAEGTFESSVAAFRMKQIMAKQCREAILLVDHSKFGQRALCKVLDIEKINTIITDSQTDPIAIKELADRGISVKIAECKTTPGNGESYIESLSRSGCQLKPVLVGSG
jgi:DeoR/GlpR family transcriptional regulator of sugar metabolism